MFVKRHAGHLHLYCSSSASRDPSASNALVNSSKLSELSPFVSNVRNSSGIKGFPPSSTMFWNSVIRTLGWPLDRRTNLQRSDRTHIRPGRSLHLRPHMLLHSPTEGCRACCLAPPLQALNVFLGKPATKASALAVPHSLLACLDSAAATGDHVQPNCPVAVRCQR
jgi:hypothetical protein